MSFIWPAMLILLLLVPLAALLYARMQRRRRQVAARYSSMLAQAGAGSALGRRRHIAPALTLAGLAILLIALARPQALVSLPRVEGTIILAFDVSGSMAADDLKPTRMEAAKAAARDFVLRQPRTVRIGVVAFSDGGLAVQAPTSEQETVLAAIGRLTPQRGTSLGQGILAALNTIAAGDKPPDLLYSNRTPTPAPAARYPSAAIVLLTDGENNQSPDPLAAAQAAAERGVRIYTVGVGSPAGTTLRVNGFTIHTQLEEPALQQIAQISEGAYYNAENQEQLQAIYDTLDLQLVVKPEQTEVTALFAGAGSVVLLIGAICSMLWLGRMP